MLATGIAETLIDTAVTALKGGDGWRSTLDDIPLPVYTTDKDGFVTYWNRACVAFAGREPELGRDRWCVTWKLYTTNGDPLPHDACPMAEAINSKSGVRGKVAIAILPDGKRRAFTPYPTPLLDDSGELTGAVNMLVDVSAEQAKALRDQAEHCRRLADATYDSKTCRVLGDMAAGFDRTADQLGNRN